MERNGAFHRYRHSSKLWQCWHVFIYNKELPAQLKPEGVLNWMAKSQSSKSEANCNHNKHKEKGFHFQNLREVALISIGKTLQNILLISYSLIDAEDERAYIS